MSILCLRSSPSCQNIAITLKGIVAQPSDMKLLEHARGIETQPDLIAIDKRTKQIRRIYLLAAVAVLLVRVD